MDQCSAINERSVVTAFPSDACPAAMRYDLSRWRTYTEWDDAGNCSATFHCPIVDVIPVEAISRSDD